jgi:glutamate racemase
MKIGICDYGIGGIGLYKLLRPRTTADIVYFSDSGFTPYGKVPEEELRARMEKVIAWFNSIGVDQIAVACNAASTVIKSTQNITGIIPHGINLVMQHRPQSIAIVGGARTIESGAYKNIFEKNRIETTQRIAQALSIRIEAGDVDSPELDADIAEIFSPISESEYILLACTHYPAIEHRIKRFTYATLLDPCAEMAEWIFENWEGMNGNSSDEWFTTGNAEQMQLAAQRAFGVELNHVEKIQL